MVDGQQWAANSARLFAKQSAPRRKQGETIGYCFEPGEAIAKKRGRKVGADGRREYFGGGGESRQSGRGLFMVARYIVNWLTPGRDDETRHDLGRT